MGWRHDYAINGRTSTFFGSGSDVIGCDWRRKFFQKWRWFFFVGTKQCVCRFMVPKRHSQNVAAGLALFTVVQTSRFIGCNVNTLFIFTYWTIHNSNSLLYFVVHTQFFLYIFG